MPQRGTSREASEVGASPIVRAGVAFGGAGSGSCSWPAAGILQSSVESLGTQPGMRFGWVCLGGSVLHHVDDGAP